MLCFIFSLIGLVSVPFVAATQAAKSCQHVPSAGPVTTLAQFPAGFWAENLALRHDGSVLVSLLEPGALALVVSNDTNPIQTVYTSPNARTRVVGVVESEPDEFFFATFEGGSALLGSVPGTGQLWHINLNDYHGAELPATLVANLTESLFLNGATLAPDARHVLLSDSQAGVVWSVDPYTGASDVAANNTFLRNTTANSLGVNGIHVRGDYLYFDNTWQAIYGRFRIDARGTQVGDVEILSQLGGIGFDDFALLGGNGAALIAYGMGDAVVFTSRDGANCSVTLAHIEGATAVKIAEGRGWKNETRTVYVTSAGDETAYLQPGPVQAAGALSSFQLVGSW